VRPESALDRRRVADGATKSGVLKRWDKHLSVLLRSLLEWLNVST
jgi:hypothetical protein